MQDQNSSLESTGNGAAQEADNRAPPAGLDPAVAAQHVWHSHDCYLIFPRGVQTRGGEEC
jgi:hypothetical protein